MILRSLLSAGYLSHSDQLSVQIYLHQVVFFLLLKLLTQTQKNISEYMIEIILLNQSKLSLLGVIRQIPLTRAVSCDFV